MAQLLKLNPVFQSKFRSHLQNLPLYTSRIALIGSPNPKWIFLQQHLASDGRYSCLFSDSSKKQEQARKALESALGGKKSEFEKWDKEIEKRKERSGGGGASGGGGWFGGGWWFGWFSDDRFWAEAQQAILTIIGIISLYLLLVKGNVMFAVVSNSLLYVLRGTRNSFAFASSKIAKVTSLSSSNVELESNSESSTSTYKSKISAKERVVRKWGTD